MQKNPVIVRYLSSFWNLQSIYIFLGTKAIKNMVSEADSKIQEYNDIFSKLKSDFMAYSVLQTNITVLQIKFSMDKHFENLGEYNCYHYWQELIISYIILRHTPG
jgi:hypothetical protein